MVPLAAYCVKKVLANLNTILKVHIILLHKILYYIELKILYIIQCVRLSLIESAVN